ncbi:poly polymerase catalytic domain-containing protein, partial [Phlyctochytrium arcticum]
MTKFDVDRGSHGLGVFYKMQVVHNKVQDLYILFNNWGDVKETGMHQRTPYSNREECIAEFLKIFSAKSGNSWENRTSAFVEKSGKYIPVKAPTHQHVSLKSLDLQDAPPSQLSDGLQDFINIIADLSSVDHAIEATDVDLQVGDFDGDAVRKGYSILLEIRDALAKMSGTGIPDVKALKATRLRILDLTNAYYRLLPKQGIKQPGERRFLDQYNLNKELVKMASLMYLGPGSDFLLAAHTRRKVINPLDYVASALKCNLTELLDRTTDEFRLVNDYMTDSSTDYGIVSLLKVDRAGETERFTPHQHNLNRRLLWHGSGMGNMMGILSQGLRIAPVEASASGYMFGKGVYFADMFKKSINYSAVTWGGKTDGYACLLLCEVALGKCYKTTDAEFLLKPKEGTESTWGHGTQEPSEVIILNDGVKIPRPPIVTTGAADNKGYYWRQRLAHNEFIVYSESQVRIRYVVLVR